MSSYAFSAEFHADPFLRRIVLLSGLIMTAAGIVLIVSLPFSTAVSLPACLCWSGLGCREFYRMFCAYVHFHAVRFGATGDVLLCDRNGDWHSGRILTGSMLLRRVGWIRIAAADGTRFAEPVRGHCRQDADWRRLQVIWRHIGGVSGSC